MGTPLTGFKVAFDATDLDATCAFYKSLGGFEVASTDRPGQIFETRHLASPHYPGINISCRASFGKRATGTSPGSVTTLGLPVADLPATIRRLAGSRWVGTNPEANPDEPRKSVCLLDPDAYQIELYLC